MVGAGHQGRTALRGVVLAHVGLEYLLELLQRFLVLLHVLVQLRFIVDVHLIDL